MADKGVYIFIKCQKSEGPSGSKTVEERNAQPTQGPAQAAHFSVVSSHAQQPRPAGTVPSRPREAFPFVQGSEPGARARGGAARRRDCRGCGDRSHHKLVVSKER